MFSAEAVSIRLSVAAVCTRYGTQFAGALLRWEK